MTMNLLGKETVNFVKLNHVAFELNWGIVKKREKVSLMWKENRRGRLLFIYVWKESQKKFQSRDDGQKDNSFN